MAARESGFGMFVCVRPHRRLKLSLALAAVCLVIVAYVLIGRAHSPKPSAESITAKQLFPLASRSAKMKLTRSGDDHGTHAVTVRPEGDRWQRALGQLTIEHLSRDEAGSILLHRADSPADRSYLVFDPAATMVPARMEQGQAVETRGRVVVRSLDDDDKQASGTYVRRVTWAGKVKVKTPAGTYIAHQLKTTEQYELGLASVSVTITEAFAPGVGSVYRQRASEVVKVGVFNETDQHSFALLEPWEQDDATASE